MLEACERRQFKLEQQQQKEEDAGHPETWVNTTAQTVLEKLIDVSLAFITVLLVVMSTVSSWVAPFFKTALLMLCMLLFLVLLSFLWRHWDVRVSPFTLLQLTSWKQIKWMQTPLSHLYYCSVWKLKSSVCVLLQKAIAHTVKSELHRNESFVYRFKVRYLSHA